MLEEFPLLSIAQAIRDADRNLKDILCILDTMQCEAGGQQLPGTDTLRANVAAVHTHLATLIPAPLQAALDTEQEAYDEAAARWDAHQANNYRG